MNFTSIQLAYQSIRRQKTRSILTILGISVGIAIVIVIMASGRGLNKFVLGQLDVFSPNTITVETKIPGVGKNSNANAMGQSTGVTITTLKDKDIESIRKHPNVAAAYGMVIGQAVVSYNGQTKTTLLLGEGYNAPEVEKMTFAEGRMFTSDEENSLQPVAVLGYATKDALFGEESALGKTIYIKGKPFHVVGVLAKRGAAFFMDMDDVVILPTKTMQKRLLGIDYVRQIVGRLKDGSIAKQTAVELTEIVRENHDITDLNKDDFAVNTMAEARDMLGSVVNVITFLLVALVCISLLVGGVGIMNIMYVSVTERTFEIGLRKAVGARRSDILKQFLSEAVLLTMAGGVAGIIIGALLALVIYLVAIYYGLIWIYSIPISSIILAVGFSAFVGLLFGIYPARKAANLNPIEALRKE